jgi:hypothetical protein
MTTAASVDDADIKQRARQIYEVRGSAPGTDLDNWLQAERELRAGSEVPRISEASVFPAGEWLFAQRARVNLLCSGIHRIEEIEGLLRDNPDEPVTIWRPGGRLRLPLVAGNGTLVLHHVDALTHDDQDLLFDWMVAAAGRTWVISTTRAPLWPLVQSGAFRDALYYRLNTVCSAIAAHAQKSF